MDKIIQWGEAMTKWTAHNTRWLFFGTAALLTAIAVYYEIKERREKRKPSEHEPETELDYPEKG